MTTLRLTPPRARISVAVIATLLVALALVAHTRRVHRRAATASQHLATVDTTLVFRDPRAAALADSIRAGADADLAAGLRSGVDINAVGGHGVSLLQWALLNQNARAMDALLSAGADPTHPDETGDTIAEYAAKAEDPHFVDVLLAHGVDPNLPNIATGATPLMSAILGGRDAQFRALLAARANVNLVDRGGNSALHVAAMIGAYARCLDLLQAGADPSLKNKQGATFQRYLAEAAPGTSTPEAAAAREAIRAWLRAHNVAVEP